MSPGNPAGSFFASQDIDDKLIMCYHFIKKGRQKKMPEGVVYIILVVASIALLVLFMDAVASLTEARQKMTTLKVGIEKDQKRRGVYGKLN